MNSGASDWVAIADITASQHIRIIIIIIIISQLIYTTRTLINQLRDWIIIDLDRHVEINWKSVLVNWMFYILHSVIDYNL